MDWFGVDGDRVGFGVYEVGRVRGWVALEDGWVGLEVGWVSLEYWWVSLEDGWVSLEDGWVVLRGSWSVGRGWDGVLDCGRGQLGGGEMTR